MTTGSRVGPAPGPRGQVHPMYVRLLDAVLSDVPDPSAPPPARSPGPLAELVRLRHVMEKHAEHAGTGWALQAVADQLAYDAALVRLARKRGVVVDIGCFDVPDQGRARLEQALVDKGVNLPLTAPADVEHGHRPGA